MQSFIITTNDIKECTMLNQCIMCHEWSVHDKGCDTCNSCIDAMEWGEYDECQEQFPEYFK